MLRDHFEKLSECQLDEVKNHYWKYICQWRYRYLHQKKLNQLLRIKKNQVRNEFLKTACDKMLDLFTRVFLNVILKTAIVPEIWWCIGVILPLYKNKGDMNNPGDYRDVTLLSCTG